MGEKPLDAICFDDGLNAPCKGRDLPHRLLCHRFVLICYHYRQVRKVFANGRNQSEMFRVIGALVGVLVGIVIMGITDRSGGERRKQSHA